jgi:CHAD domain-containing protein
VLAGVLADVDPEYLHDLRTSVRGIRSLLRLAGAGLVPEEQFARFAADFAWLGRLSAPLRDLDVSLRELAGGAGTDLSGLGDDLEPVRRHLARQRRRSLDAVRSGLRSPRGTALSGEWRAALDKLAAPQAVVAASTRTIAVAQAATAYRRIVKIAAPVSGSTEPDQLHRLRRRCKQMRYLMDAYASVYAVQAQRQVVSALKGLQDCLGEIQDVDVQRRQLADLAETMRRRDADVDTLLAIGALRDRLLRRDAAARRILERRLERFCSATTRARVAALGSADG